MTQRNVCIYIHLPGDDRPVFVGKSVSIVEEEGERAGKPYALFAYAASYLARQDAISIDPFNLPLPDGKIASFETDIDEGLITFGAFRDASPDSWGRGRMTRVALRELSEIDFILASGEDRSGFLAFGEDDSGANISAPWAPKNYDQTRYLDIQAMGLIIEEMADSRLTEEELRQLLLYGSSLGGARPKATIRYNDKIWLAKAPRSDDQYNVPRGEFAAMELARRCGISVPETGVVTLEGRDVYLIERFDREVLKTGVARLGMISALTAFGISDNAMNVKKNASYNKLAEKIVIVSKERANEDRRELFRRIVFNILVANTDDHPRNHAFLFKDGRWALSPLYDVQPLPYRASTKHLAMRFGESGGEGTVANLLSKSKDFGLSRGEAIDEIKFVLDHFSNWERVFQKAGVPRIDMDGYRVSFAVAAELRRDVEDG